MADQENTPDISENEGGDVEMNNGEEVVETIQATPAEEGEQAATGLENTMPDLPDRQGFAEYVI